MLTNYIKKDSVIHDLNPLVKLVWSISIIILSFIISDLKLLIALTIIGLILGLFTKLFTQLIKTLFFVMLPLLIMLIFFHGIVNPSATQEWFTIWFITLKWDGVLIGLTYFFRLLSFIIISYILIFTTHPADLVNALLKIGMPKQIGYVVLATIQFIPLMLDDATKIMEAQQARGLETKTNVIKRLFAFIPMIMPIILSGIELSYDRTISLEIRAFFNQIKRTSFRIFKWKITDTFWLVIILAIIFVVVIFL